MGVALQQCEGKKVAILDLETLATAKGFKTCSLDVKHVYVNMENGAGCSDAGQAVLACFSVSRRPDGAGRPCRGPSTRLG